MNTDPIADLLTRIRNAAKARQLKTVAPYSKLKVAILDVMKKRKFISNYKVIQGKKKYNEIEIEFNSESGSLSLKRVSKPGQRIYVKRGSIRPVSYGYGISVFSTPRGVMTGDEAVKEGVGGEYLCQIW